jgi:hypothetical protein
MLRLTFWCFILATVKVSHSLNYDETTYNIYPRIDLACPNSSFSFDLLIEASVKKAEQLCLYEDQSGGTKFILIKISNDNRLTYSDHLNTNKQIPIELTPNTWFKFTYARNLLSNNAQISLSQINSEMENRLVATVDIESDMSNFGVTPNEYSQLFVGGLPENYNSSKLSDPSVKTLGKFNGQLRNLFYVNLDTTKMSYEYNSDASSLLNVQNVFKCTTCEQINKRQYAVFTLNRLKQLNDKCELDSIKLNLCSKQCTCLTVNNDIFSNYKCECSKQFDYCKMNGTYLRNSSPLLSIFQLRTDRSV